MIRKMEEPTINVGIMVGAEFEFELSGNFLCNGVVVTGLQRVSAENGEVAWVDDRYGNRLLFSPVDKGCCFELKGVTIGINFHWERKEYQRFAGALRIEVNRDDKSSLVAINEISVEEYLKSVISSEMRAASSEALLKAHAVVSRSWLLRQLADRGKHVADTVGGWTATVVDNEKCEELVRWYDREDHKQFDVCADDHCQRYQGVTRQTSLFVEAAVEATRGLVLVWNGKVCDARFSKCCGGRSELFENCWEDEPHPYLESVADRGNDNGRDFCDTADDKVLGQVLNDYDLETKNFYRWEVTYSESELSQLVSRRSGLDLGFIRELRPLDWGKSGRITRLLIKGDRKSVVVGKELEIRRWLSESHLHSSAFEVIAKDSPRGKLFTLKGKGWGHGVGMCQIGAAVMGARGYSHTRILNHYFPKAELEKLY